MPRSGGEAEDVAKLLEDPKLAKNKNRKTDAPLETKIHIIGAVGRGQIIGFEEVVLNRSNKYTTTAICSSTEGA